MRVLRTPALLSAHGSLTGSIYQRDRDEPEIHFLSVGRIL